MTHLLPPILIIPVLLQKFNTETLFSNKFSDNKTYTLKLMQTNIIDDEEDDIDVGFRQSLNRGMVSKNKPTEDPKAEITARKNGNEMPNKTDIVNSTEKVTKEVIKIVQLDNTTGTIASTTLSENLNLASNNSNEGLNVTSLTTAAPNANLPPITDNRWQNFTVSTNHNFGNESTTKEPYLSTNGGPYSVALYNNEMIDQISITTNSYTNEESPLPSPKDDRWRTFSQKTQYSANEFKPLAGQYYDGFLHKPLIMLPGFIPRQYYNS